MWSEDAGLRRLGSRPKRQGTNSSDPCFLTTIPRLVFVSIVQFLPVSSIARLARTCRTCYRTTELPTVWARLLSRDYACSPLKFEGAKKEYHVEYLCHSNKYMRQILKGELSVLDCLTDRGYRVRSAFETEFSELPYSFPSCLARRGLYDGFNALVEFCIRTNFDNCVSNLLKYDQYEPSSGAWVSIFGHGSCEFLKRLLHIKRYCDSIMSTGVFYQMCGSAVGADGLHMMIGYGDFDLDADGGKALLTAVVEKRSIQVRYLVQAGARVVHDAVQFACIKGYERILGILLSDKRCDPSAHDNAALRAALSARKHDVWVIKQLLRDERMRISREELCSMMDEVELDDSLSRLRYLELAGFE